MSDRTKRKILAAIFYRTAAGSEPVRDWLNGLSHDVRRVVGQDFATVLLHGFTKKTQQTPDQELDLAVKRKEEIENDGETKE